MIRALFNWDAHTSEGEGRCEKFKDCPFMGKMPGLVKISLGGASGGNDNKDENNESNDEDTDNKRGIDGVADLGNQSDGANETENDVGNGPVRTNDEDEQIGCLWKNVEMDTRIPKCQNC